MPARKRVLSDQAFHIGRLFPGMQPQEMAAHFNVFVKRIWDISNGF